MTVSGKEFLIQWSNGRQRLKAEWNQCVIIKSTVEKLLGIKKAKNINTCLGICILTYIDRTVIVMHVCVCVCVELEAVNICVCMLYIEWEAVNICVYCVVF